MQVLAAALSASLVLAATAAASAPGGSAPSGEDYAPPSPTAPQPQAPAASGTRLVATVGPSSNISLRTAAGTRVRRLKAGRYTITVRDRSDFHNFHLRGPSVDRKTGVAFTGTTRWTVRFRKGKTYRYRCDPHLDSMRGSFRAT